MPASDLTLDTVIQRSSELLSSELDEETVMMDIETGDYYGLNNVGSRIWAHSENPVSVSELCEKLQGEFEVPADQCQSDVLDFLKELEERKVIQKVTD